MIVRVSVLHGDGKTCTAESDLGRLGQLPHEAAAIPDRVSSHLGLRLLPSTRHLNPGSPSFSFSFSFSISSSFSLSSLSREMTHRVHLIDTTIRSGDIQHNHTYILSRARFTFLYIIYVSIYITSNIYNNFTFLVFNIYTLYMFSHKYINLCSGLRGEVIKQLLSKPS